jgi:hypothetical protein
MSKASLVALGRVGAITCVLAAGVVGCKKDEPPPPLPVAQAVTTPEAPLELKPEDAGQPVAPKAAAKPVARKPSGLQQCCIALRQNANNAPEPTKSYMLGAAVVCDMTAAQGKDKASAAGQIAIALKGAGLPSDCK